MRNCFPFETIRKGQDQFYADAREALGQGGIIIAHAPTGIGKTAAALAAAVEVALDRDRVVFFMTPRQSQHRIAIETLRQIESRHRLGLSVVDIISKQAMCPAEISREYHAVFGMLCTLAVKTNSCPFWKSDPDLNSRIARSILHVEELTALARREGVCPNRAALEVAQNARVVVCDYNYVFSDMAEGIRTKIDVEPEDIIMVVDEAHNLPERIRDHLSGTLTMHMLREAARTLQSHDRVLYTHLLRMEDHLNAELRKLADDAELLVDKQFLMGIINRTLAETIDRRMSLGDLLTGLRHIGEIEIQKEQTHTVMSVCEFLQGWMQAAPTTRMLTRRDTPALRYQLLDPSVMSRSILGQTAGAIFMSGTLYPTRMFGDILGAAESGRPVTFGEYPSPFPPENRRIIVSTSVTTRYVDRGERMYRLISHQIADVANAVYENTAVFFPSYHFLEQVWDQFPPNPLWRIYKEQRGMSKEQRNALFEQMTADHGSYRAMLWGVQAGSLSEGMDYSGNALKVIMVVGLPLVPPSLYVDQLIGFYSDKFGHRKGRLYAYIYPALNKVHQAAGRGIRSEEDVGIIVLMDRRFADTPYRDCMPPEFDIIYTDEPAAACRGFLKMVRAGGARER